MFIIVPLANNRRQHHIKLARASIYKQDIPDKIRGHACSDQNKIDFNRNHITSVILAQVFDDFDRLQGFFSTRASAVLLENSPVIFINGGFDKLFRFFAELCRRLFGRRDKIDGNDILSLRLLNAAQIVISDTHERIFVQNRFFIGFPQRICKGRSDDFYRFQFPVFFR